MERELKKRFVYVYLVINWLTSVCEVDKIGPVNAQFETTSNVCPAYRIQLL